MRKSLLTVPDCVRSLLRDERGFVLSAELVLILTLGVLAMVVGVHAVAKSINSELTDVAQSFSSLNQSYFVHGFSYYCPRVGFNAVTGGSGFIDGSDACDCAALGFNGRGVAVTGRSKVVDHGPGVVSGPAGVVAPSAAPCPPGSIPVEWALPCPGDCPCETGGPCPPGEVLNPAPFSGPNAPHHDAKPKSKGDSK